MANSNTILKYDISYLMLVNNEEKTIKTWVMPGICQFEAAKIGSGCEKKITKNCSKKKSTNFEEFFNFYKRTY